VLQERSAARRCQAV